MLPRPSQAEAELVGALQDIPLPLKGDDAAVKKFAQKVEALKRKVRSGS